LVFDSHLNSIVEFSFFISNSFILNLLSSAPGTNLPGLTGWYFARASVSLGLRLILNGAFFYLSSTIDFYFPITAALNSSASFLSGEFESIYDFCLLAKAARRFIFMAFYLLAISAGSSSPPVSLPGLLVSPVVFLAKDIELSPSNPTLLTGFRGGDKPDT